MAAERKISSPEPTLVAEPEKKSLLDEVMAATKLDAKEDGYRETRQGLKELIKDLLKKPKGGKVDKTAVDEMIADLDKQLSTQMDSILHHPDFQKLESAWRGLAFVVSRTDFRQKNEIWMLNASKDKLLDDFHEDPVKDVTKSGLYHHVYTSEYGQFGGEPFSAMIANYEFGPGSQDLELMKYAASVAAMAHAPFIAAASPKFFFGGSNSFLTLPGPKDLEETFKNPLYAKWNAFRDTEDARYVGLTMPRFLLRLPYEAGVVKAFNYTEEVKTPSLYDVVETTKEVKITAKPNRNPHENYLWGNSAFAFATRLTNSFAKYGWCANIIGPLSGGAVKDLPLHTYQEMGQHENKIPTEILVSDRREYELAELGFIPLTMRKGSDEAAFFSANSTQKPKQYGISEEGMEAETNSRLGTQLPYMFIINRLAHYIKVLQREQIGSWKERIDLEDQLNKWIKQYVADQDGVPAEIRSKKPLRRVTIKVEEVPNDPGWYRVRMWIRPHFKYMGASFALSLVGKLDKKWDELENKDKKK